jgi:hypothetical protein
MQGGLSFFGATAIATVARGGYNRRVEAELTGPVAIAHADGRLNRDAIGWARHPIQRCNLPRELSRVARWNYWCIGNRSSALTILVADVGYFGAVLLSFLDFAARAPVERVWVRPGGLGCALPDSPRGDFALEASRLHLEMRERAETLRIEADARTLFGRRLAVEITVDRPCAHETINVLVPWDETRFHFTSKQQALPARGVVRVDGRAHHFQHQSFACLDFGRGRWPKGIEWNWAFASGSVGARTLGLNLGGTWTDGTGVSENGFVLDGRVHKIAEPVEFALDRRNFMAPWRLHSSRVDLGFHPFRERALRLPLVVVHQMVGAFSGTLVEDGGARLAVDDLVGVAEWVRARWSL